MKIFAKRKKTPVKTSASTTGSANNTSPARSDYKSDSVVEDLLRNKDPSEWNAKEKRMIKRYQDRKASEAKDVTTTNKSDDSALPVASEEIVTENDANGQADKKQDNKEDSESNSGSGSDSDEDGKEDDNDGAADNNDDGQADAENTGEAEDGSEQKGEEPSDLQVPSLDLESVLDPSILDVLNSKQRRKLSRMLAKDGASAVGLVVQEARDMVNPQKQTENKDDEDNSSQKKDDGPLTRAQVEELLATLNSKQRRKLSRRLEREGDSCLEEVKAEADKLLNEPAEGTSADAKPGSKDAAPSATGKKRKRRRGPTDLSGLTPEERLRREEQRKMQREAAEEREKGEGTTPGHKHALNSERRRANRRKPKWAPKQTFGGTNPDKVEHNSSGFNHRKFSKTGA